MTGLSIIIPCYNRNNSIRKSVLSILQQDISYSHWDKLEVIVVDDGSTDGSMDHISDLPVKIIYTGGRKGACFARNLGVKVSTYDWIGFNDSDDIWLPEKLNEISKVKIDENEIFYSQLIQCDVTSSKLKIFPKATVSCKLKNLMERNHVSTQTIIMKKDLFEKVNGFDESLSRFQDWDFVIRIAQLTQFCFINKPLVLAYVQNDSITKDYRKGIEMRKVLLDKHSSLYDRYRVCKGRALFDYYLRFFLYKMKLKS